MGVRSQAFTTKVPILWLVILFKPKRSLWDVFDRRVEQVFSVGPSNCSSWNEPLSCVVDFVQKGEDAITCNFVVVLWRGGGEDCAQTVMWLRRWYWNYVTHYFWKNFFLGISPFYIVNKEGQELLIALDLNGWREIIQVSFHIIHQQRTWLQRQFDTKSLKERAKKQTHILVIFSKNILVWEKS